MKDSLYRLFKRRKVSTMQITPEQLAMMFHTAYERLAPHYQYDTKPESAVKWEDVPEPNKSLMIATAETVLITLAVLGDDES